MDCSMPGSSALHYLTEFAQIHVHWVDEAIWLSHPLPSSPSPFAFSQHQSLFQWVSSLHQVTKCWSFSFSIGPFNEYPGLISLGLTGLISLLSNMYDWIILLCTWNIVSQLNFNKKYIYTYTEKEKIQRKEIFKKTCLRISSLMKSVWRTTKPCKELLQINHLASKKAVVGKRKENLKPEERQFPKE